VPFDAASQVPAVCCAHCGNTVAIPESLRPRTEHVAINVSQIPRGPVARPSAVGCLVPLLLAGGIIAFTTWRMGSISFGPPQQPFQHAETAVTTRTRILQPERLLPGAGSEQIFAIVRNYGGSKHQDALARFDLASGARTWELPATYQSAFAADDRRVFVTSKSRLGAYDRANGSAIWEVSLSDEVQGDCEDCLGAFAGRVVAHTKDEALQVFDAATGRAVMSRELGRPNRVSIVGDRLLVIARDAKGGAVNATVIDADGREAVSFPVRCSAEWGSGALGWSDFTYADASSGTLVAWYEGGCVQRYDLAAGALTSSIVTDRTASLGANAAVVPANGVLYLGEDENLHALPLSGGRPIRLANAPDYSIRPIGTSGAVVVVRARRRVGSTRFEIWGIEARTGARLWQLKMGDGARPVEPPDEFIGTLAPDRDDVAFTAHVDGDRLRIVKAGGRGGPWVSVEVVDLATGTSKGEKRISVEASDHWNAPRVFGWRGPVVWLLVDGRATSIDTAEGKILSQIP
jgi:outer membrane protein assembly factor BamB